MRRLPEASLIIGVASSAAERKRLARLLAGADAFLLVSTTEQARAFLDLASVDVEAVEAGEVPPERGLSGVAEPVPLTIAVSAELRLDLDRRVLHWRDQEIALTRLEHDFLHCLVAEPGEVWTYQRLHLAVWGNEHLGHGSHIHSVVKRLRRKLADLGATVTIQAVRGVGFHLLPL